tara:strand:+ start:303 stop:566 length:264 start_codon:yes stop_codon:yes gene_type:complete
MRSALKVVNVVISTSSTTTSSSDNSDDNDNEGKKKKMKKNNNNNNKPLTNPIDALGGSFAFLEYLNVVFTRHLSVGKAWHDLEHEIR